MPCFPVGSVVEFNNPPPNSAMHPKLSRQLELGDQLIVEESDEHRIYYTDYSGKRTAVAWNFLSLISAPPLPPEEVPPICTCQVWLTGCTCGRIQWERERGIS